MWCPVFYESKVLCGTIPESTTHRTTTNTNNTRRRERESLHIIVRYFPFVAQRKFASRTFTLRSTGETFSSAKIERVRVSTFSSVTSALFVYSSSLIFFFFFFFFFFFREREEERKKKRQKKTTSFSGESVQKESESTIL